MSAPAWFGRKAPTTPLPAGFIRAMATPRPDGSRSLTPPGLETGTRVLLEWAIGLAAIAGAGALFWWLALRG